VAEPPLEAGVDEIRPHARRTGHQWVDLIVAFSAIAISVISLFIAVDNGRTERKLVAASSWPFLVFDKSLNGGLEAGSRVVGLGIENGGVGPARVQSAVVRLDGRIVRSREEILSICCGMPEATDPDGQVKVGLVTENPIVGVLAAKDSVTFLAMRERPGNAALWNAFRALRGLTFQVCYCSVLDDCWLTDLKSTTTPTPVMACPARRDGYRG
jgi:hypothetical protein